MKSLTTLELDELLKNNAVTKKYFLGTFPACMSPLTTRNKGRNSLVCLDG